MFLLLAALVLVSSASSAAAEICTTGVAGIATSCEAASALAQDLARRRADRMLGVDPAVSRGNRLTNPGSPQGSAYLGEASGVRIAGAPDITRSSIGPELKHRIDGGNGASVEPFA